MENLYFTKEDERLMTKLLTKIKQQVCAEVLAKPRARWQRGDCLRCRSALWSPAMRPFLLRSRTVWTRTPLRA
mgnify:CR=1 FL=1